MNFHSTSAFSLLEIVVAIIILGLVITGIFGLFTSAHELIGNAGQRLQATNYARTVLEQLRLYVSASSTSPTNAGTGPGCALEVLPTQPHDFDEIGLTLPPITLSDGTVLEGNYSVVDLSTEPQINTTGRGVEVIIRYSKP